MLTDSAVLVSGVLCLHQILSFWSVGCQAFVVVIVVDELVMHLLLYMLMEFVTITAVIIKLYWTNINICLPTVNICQQTLVARCRFEAINSHCFNLSHSNKSWAVLCSSVSMPQIVNLFTSNCISSASVIEARFSLNYDWWTAHNTSLVSTVYIYSRMLFIVR